MRVCEICGKKSLIQKSGAHQYGGGWAMRATKKRAVWQVNLHGVKVTYNPKVGLRSSSGTAGLKGVRRTMRLCTRCLRRVKAEMKKAQEVKQKKIQDAPVPVLTSATA